MGREGRPLLSRGDVNEVTLRYMRDIEEDSKLTPVARWNRMEIALELRRRLLARMDDHT